MDFILHSLNIFILKYCLSQVFILLFDYYEVKYLSMKYYWLFCFIHYIMSSTPTKDLVVLTNVTSTNTIFQQLLFFMINGEKL